MIHLSTWFVVGGAMASAFFFVSGRRKEAVLASVAMIGLFLLVSLTGLWRVLGTGMGDDPERTSGVATIEWTNPWLFAPLLLWLVPALFRRDRGGAVLAGGVALFTGVTMALQARQIADGQPYPSSLHYFELIDPTLAIAATLALVAVARSGVWWRRLAIGLGLALILSQGFLMLAGQQWVFLNRFWFWMLLWPGG